VDRYLQNYIGGQWVDSIGGTPHQVISPSTEEPCTEIVLGTKADVDAAVAAARAALPAWSKTTVDERLAVIRSKHPIASLAVTMCLEHFTAILANQLLREPRHLAGADAEAAAISLRSSWFQG